MALLQLQFIRMSFARARKTPMLKHALPWWEEMDLLENSVPEKQLKGTALPFNSFVRILVFYRAFGA